VKSFFTPASQKEKNEKLSWTVVDDTLLVAVYTPSSAADDSPAPTNPKVLKKIAAFDFVSEDSGTDSGCLTEHRTPR
jgi:hypothetical protein